MLEEAVTKFIASIGIVTTFLMVVYCFFENNPKIQKLAGKAVVLLLAVIFLFVCVSTLFK